MSKYNLFAGWQEWCADRNWQDYGGTWVRQVNDTTFHFIELINWVDSCGEDEADEVGYRYCIDLAEVNIAKIGKKEKDSALRYIGSEFDNDPLTIAGACYSYGNKAPISSENTNNCHRTIRELKAESRRLEKDQEYHSEMMRRTVNRIGSTAEEYMIGDLYSPIMRGMEAEDPQAMLMGRLYGIE